MKTMYLHACVTFLFLTVSSGCTVGNSVMIGFNHTLIRDVHFQLYAREVMDAQANARPPPTYDQWNAKFHTECGFGEYVDLSTRFPELTPTVADYSGWQAAGKPKAKGPPRKDSRNSGAWR